jgi:hypothetical protein
MRLGCANIKNYPDMPARKVAADGKKMSGLCDIWGMQENNPAEDDDAIAKVLGENWDIVHPNTDIPVWYRKDLIKVVGTRVHLMPFDPVLALTPRPRNLTGTTFKLRGRESVPNWVVINSHFIAGGMNGARNQARSRQWKIEWTHLNRFVSEYKRKGLTVFVMGDFNHPRPPKPTTNFTWLVGKRLDRIGVTTTGTVEVDEIQDGVVKLNSDHSGQWTRVVLSKK